MKAANLAIALRAAIEYFEAKGMGDSALVAGWKQDLAKLEQGEIPKITP